MTSNITAKLLVVLGCVLPCGLSAQDQEWPESCREHAETIFDRHVHLDDELQPVPAVPRHEDSLGLTGRYVDIGEVRLWVEEAGEGLPLILVSGGPGTSHHYFHPHLLSASRFARLIYVDLRGVGLSDRDPNGRYSVAQAVADLEGLRQVLGIESWVFFGNSFGGSLGMVYALEHPGSLRGLVLSSSALPMSIDIGLGVRQREYMAPEEIERVAEIYNVAGQPITPVHGEWVTPELQAVMLFNGFMNGDWKRRHLCRMSEEEIARFARYEFHHDRNYYHQMAQDHARLDLKDRFLDSPVPTLVLEGEWDLAFGPGKADVMREQFPRADVVVLSRAGHTLFEDDPAGFFNALRSFARGLNGHDRQGEELDP